MIKVMKKEDDSKVSLFKSVTLSFGLTSLDDVDVWQLIRPTGRKHRPSGWFSLLHVADDMCMILGNPGGSFLDVTLTCMGFKSLDISKVTPHTTTYMDSKGSDL